MIDYYKQQRDKFDALYVEAKTRAETLECAGRDASHLRADAAKHKKEYDNYAEAISNARQAQETATI